jgi:zona occludens toxin (predicted ATPase)
MTMILFFLVFVIVIMMISMMLRRSRIISKANLILMIMGMPNKYFINVHNNHKSKHSNNHS